MTRASQLLQAALTWRDCSLRADNPAFRRLWRRNMRDCALAWRKVRVANEEDWFNAPKGGEG